MLAMAPDPFAEFHFVAKQRALRASWGAVARMINRSEHDTRKAYDPSYAPDLPWVATPPPTAAAPAPKPLRHTVLHGPARPRTLSPGVKPNGMGHEALIAVANGKRSPFGVGHAIGRTPTQATNLLYDLKAKGLVESRRDAGERLAYAITAAGRAELKRLAREARS